MFLDSVLFFLSVFKAQTDLLLCIQTFLTVFSFSMKVTLLCVVMPLKGSHPFVTVVKDKVVF